MTLQEVLDEIFESYMRVKDSLKGKLDRETRNPQSILNVLEKHHLIPNRHSTMRITGSKGKGTLALSGAATLVNRYPEKKTALLISPEEFSHLDRMRINGIPISENDFVREYKKLREDLLKIPEQGPMSYLSPSGAFLAIALSWFKSQKVDYFVLECGRGVKYDEVGKLSSKVSLISSILAEHLEYLGPSFEEVKRDKESISENSMKVVYPKSLIGHTWESYAKAMTREGVSSLIDESPENIETIIHSHSFGEVNIDRHKMRYEAIIHCSQLANSPYFNNLMKDDLVFISLPKGKDISILHELKKRQAKVVFFKLEGKRGWLEYEIPSIDSLVDRVVSLNFDDLSRIKKEFDIHNQDVYCVGTQSFIRLVKRMSS